MSTPLSTLLLNGLDPKIRYGYGGFKYEYGELGRTETREPPTIPIASGTRSIVSEDL